jgi:two-component system KDP operon response regulator KdpE
MPVRILVVDDEVAIVRVLRSCLKAKGFETLASMNGLEAIQIIERESPDLLILDIVMPDMDGFEVLKRVREWSQIPIIMLSALGNEEDKVKCLDLGADDYLSKPFGTKELIARVRAVLRRVTSASMPGQPAFTSGDISVDFAKRRVAVAGREVKLTPTEYSLLKELAVDAGKVFTHIELLRRVWGAEYGQELEYLHVFISRLRAKLEPDPKNPQYIKTISGVGYMLQD